MNVRAIPAAQDDARRAGDRLQSEKRGLGRRFAVEFTRAVAAIRANPWFHARTDDDPDDPETREYFIPTFGYRVIFTIRNDEAVIVAVVHAACPPGLWLPRLTDLDAPEEQS